MESEAKQFTLNFQKDSLSSLMQSISRKCREKGREKGESF